MERNILLGYPPPHQSFSNSNASSSPQEDVNFSDVFGGPPRRSSMYEIRQRYSFSGSADSDSLRGGGAEEDGEDEEDTWPGMREKPVFGEDGGNRRRRKGNEFFDDIFKGGDESSCSTTPRKPQDRSDQFSSAPGSRVLSPARPPKPDPFGVSLPSPLRLTPRLTKGVDLPTFGSPTRSALRSKDQTSDGISYSHSPSPSLSRFSSQSIQVQEEPQNDIRSFYHQSSLSREVSRGSEELSSVIQSENTDKGGNMKNGANGSEVVSDSLQFHFSIYRWGSKGVPLMMHHHRGRNSSRPKEMGTAEMPFSSKGSMLSENAAEKLTNASPHDVDKPSFGGSMEASKGNDSLLRTPSRAESSQMVEEEVTSFPHPVNVSRVEKTVENVSSDTILDNAREKTKPKSQSEVGLGGKSEKETQAVVQEVFKSDGVKPLSSLFKDDSTEKDNHDKYVKDGGNLVNKSNKKASVGKIQVGKKAKKQDEKTNALTSTEVDKTSVEGSPKKSGNNLGRIKVKGKMKELVKIFNHEVSSKPKTVVDPQSQSCRWDGTFRPEKEASHRTAEMYQKVQPHLNNETASQDASISELKKVTTAEVYEFLKQSEKRYSATKTENYTSSDTVKLKSTSVSSTASDPDVSKTVVGDPDESFQQDFVMKELPLEKNEEPQPSKDHEDMQVYDAKIRKWSSGKEGNIRSLLSTLQYVLWPESGWKPVPLVNIIEGNAVKRSYQRALLCLHPDKLQQKGAASHQKYIAEKVFDILQEAWTQFNSLGSL